MLEEENQTQELDDKVGTETTDAQDSVSNESTEPVSKEEVKTFTQEQVDEIVKSRLNRQSEQFYKKFDLADEKELADRIGKSQSYEVMKERYENIKNETDEVKRELAFIKNDVNPKKYDDVITYFKGKNLEFTEDALKSALSERPEWKNYTDEKVKTTTITSLGTEQTNKKVGETDEEKQKRIFGV